MPSPVPESGSTSVDRGQQYKSDRQDKVGCGDNCGTNNNNQQLSNVNNNQGTLSNNTGSSSGTMDIWSGLNLDQLRLEWSGTDPNSKEYTISTYLPQGLNPSDLSISVDERSRMLSMQCQTRNHQEKKDEQGTYYMSQDSASYTQRSFTLPEDVDLNGIKATKNSSGGFQLHLPKNTQQTQSSQGGVKQITIQ